MSAISCATTSLAPGASTTCTATYPVTLADMDAGSVRNTATAFAVDRDGEPVTSPEDSATVDVLEATSFALSKTADHQGVTRVGEIVTYTFVGTNTGNVSAHDVEVSDALDGLSPLDCAPAAPAILPPGANIVCTATYAVTQDDLDRGSILNTATMTGADPHGDPIPDATAQDVVSAAITEGMTLEKTADPVTVAKEGDPIRYILKATNTGNQTLTGVTIDDPKAGTAALECTPQQGSTLGPREAMVCQATYLTTQDDVNAGQVVNTAILTATRQDGTVMDPVTQSVTVTVTPAPALTLTKTADRDAVGTVDDDLTYTFVATNTGNQTLTDVALADSMPGLSRTRCTRAPALDPPPDPPPAWGATSVLKPGDSLTCTATYDVTQATLDAGTNLTNTATLTGISPQGQEIPADPATETVAVTRTPALTVTKTASVPTVTAVGDPVGYTITTTNTGNVTINGVTVTDGLSGTRTLSCTLLKSKEAGPAPATLPLSLAPGAVVTCTTPYEVIQADLDASAVINVATAAGLAAGSPPDGPPTVARDEHRVPAAVTPSMSLTKSASPTTASRVGEPITYTFVAANTGPVTLTDVAITDPLPGLAALDCDSSGDLGPGIVRTCTARYAATQHDLDAGSIANTARLSATSGPDRTPVPPRTASALVTTVSTATMTLTKRATLGDANGNGLGDPGETIRYLIVVGNTGTQTLTGTQVTDQLPGLTGLRCAIPMPMRVPPGSSVPCTAEYRITAADQANGRVVNTAVARADQAGPLTASATVEIPGPTPPGPPRDTPPPGVNPPPGDTTPPPPGIWTPPRENPPPPIRMPRTGAELLGAAIALGVICWSLGGTLVLAARRRRDERTDSETADDPDGQTTPEDPTGETTPDGGSGRPAAPGESAAPAERADPSSPDEGDR